MPGIKVLTEVLSYTFCDLPTSSYMKPYKNLQLLSVVEINFRVLGASLHLVIHPLLLTPDGDMESVIIAKKCEYLTRDG